MLVNFSIGDRIQFGCIKFKNEFFRMINDSKIQMKIIVPHTFNKIRRRYEEDELLLFQYYALGV